MPRPLRLEYQDAWYHVMNRGAGYQEIFKTKKHREMFLDLLSDASSLFGIKIHAYCLMDNHYHLLINTPRANLAQAMRNINGLYTQRFNRSVKRDGPLFRGRYKAIVVDRDAYLLQVSRYIHLNPVVAKLRKLPDHYQWSSCQYYHPKKDKPTWLQIDAILSMISNQNKSAGYAVYLKEGLDPQTKLFYKKENTPAIFGSKKFKDKLLHELNDYKIQSHKADYNRTRELPSVSHINRSCAIFFKISEDELCYGKRGVKNDFRKIGMYACRIWSSEKLSKIATVYHCNSHGNIANAVTEIKQRLLKEKNLSVTLQKLKAFVFN